MQLTFLEIKKGEVRNRNIIKMALAVGAESEKCNFFSLDSEHQEIRACLDTGEYAIIASASVLIKIASRLGNLCSEMGGPVSSRRALIIYGFEGTPSESAFLRQLTQDNVLGANDINVPKTVCSIDANSRDLCGPLAGVDVTISKPKDLSTFILKRDSKAARVIMKLGEEPYFLLLKVGNMDIFLIGSNAVPDIDEAIPKEIPIIDKFAPLLPFVICIRDILKERCWTNDSPKACLIIDDPLIRRRYGFIKYADILKSTGSRAFCASIAFIPWNYRRTSRKAAKLFLSHPERFSLSIHGCDHTGGEYGPIDEKLMRYKAKLAIDRMNIHKQLSGLPYDSVMVFPQGVFSSAAIRALKSCGYLSVVNSTIYPIDGKNDTLTMKELLDVAVTKYSNFPLFVRRYPNNYAELAFDLFMGKPAFIVEHHSFFRNGYFALNELVDRLNTSEEKLKWASLSRICSSAYLKRVAENGDIHIKFYTDRFLLKNETRISQKYRLFRRVAPEMSYINVTINGQHAEYERESDDMAISLSLNAGQEAEVRIAQNYIDEEPIYYNQSIKYRICVLIRRYLSEIRDNYIEKSPLLISGVQSYRRLIKFKN